MDRSTGGNVAYDVEAIKNILREIADTNREVCGLLDTISTSLERIAGAAEKESGGNG